MSVRHCYDKSRPVYSLSIRIVYKHYRVDILQVVSIRDLLAYWMVEM